MNPRQRTLIVNGLVALAALYVVGYLGIWQWSICRIEVPPGQSLRLRYKGPFPIGSAPQAPEGTLAKVDERGRPLQVGILERMPGPGRHFYSPLEYEWILVPDVVVEPGMVGVVTAKVGKELPAGTSLADEGYRGIRRRGLTPGRYRINSYAYQVDLVGIDQCVGSKGGIVRKEKDVTLISPGYVGVVTNKESSLITREGKGIQPKVLQPGIYFLNPAEKQVDIISVGFNETTLKVVPARNPDGSPAMQPAPVPLAGTERPVATDPIYMEGKGIEFPSNDGFPIHLDYTAIWGILPDQAPDIVRQFGDLDTVEQTVILPQIRSICRIHGSKRGAVDLLVGDTREAFQTDTAEDLERVLESKNLMLLFGLTRHIYVPQQVREPIQKANIANELKLTREQEQLTEKAHGEFTKAKEEVTSQEEQTAAQTENKVAQLKAEGEKVAGEIAAETSRLAAKIDAEAAKIDAQITTTLGGASAKKIELTNQAKAERFRQYVQALGGAEAYNRYMFAEKLPEDLRLGIFYAGPGTFWTDLKGFEQILLGKIAAETQQRQAPSRAMAEPTADRR